jgi:anti-sigma B factor antagonist
MYRARGTRLQPPARGSGDAARLFVLDWRWVVPAGRHPVLWIGKAAVISAPAQIDAGNADDVLGCMLTVICEGALLLIVDMSTVTFCDCAGVGALVRAFRQARARGIEMRMAGHGPPVTRVLSLTGTDRLIDSYPTVPEALIGGLIPPGSLGPGDGQAQPSSKASGCGGSPLTLVTIAAAMSRSFTLRFCDARCSRANARAWVHRSCAMITPRA